MITGSDTAAISLPDIDRIPVHDRRTELVEGSIDNLWRIAQDEPLKDYHFHGTSESYLPDRDHAGRLVNTSVIIQEQTARLGRPLRILDIGCGVGGVISSAQRDGHNAQGITANDYREARVREAWKTPTTLPVLKPDSYIHGDANRLDDIKGLYDEYDLIFSRWTFLHLAEPLGTLEQAVDLLAIQGVIAITHLTASYASTRPKDKGVDGQFVLDTVNESGLRVISGREGLSVGIFVGTELIARKVTPDTSLSFDVNFEEIDPAMALKNQHPTGWEYVKAA